VGGKKEKRGDYVTHCSVTRAGTNCRICVRTRVEGKEEEKVENRQFICASERDTAYACADLLSKKKKKR